METAIVVDANNQPLTNGAVPFSRIPVAGDYIRIAGVVLKVTGVLFTLDAPGAVTYVKAVPPMQGP